MTGGIIGSVCAKHPELNGKRNKCIRNGKSYPGDCILCNIARSKAWRLANHDRDIANHKMWAKLNPEKVKISARLSRTKRRSVDLPKGRLRSRSWRQNPANFEKKRQQKIRYYNKHYESLLPKFLAATRRRQASKISASPKWANEFFINEIYDLASRRTRMLGYAWHVDHIVPLKSSLVCGLHVENNLQVIPARVNLQKHNKYWPDMPVWS